MPEPEEISIVTEIRRLTEAKSFRSFTIIMASGNHYEIAREDAVAVGRGVITLNVLNGGEHFLRHNQISELSIHQRSER